VACRRKLTQQILLICPGQRATFPIPQVRSDDFLHAPHNDSGMSYACFYVPSPTDTRTPSSLKGTLSKFERHAVNQRGAAAIAIMSELTASHRKGRKNPDWHGAGGNVLFLDGHVVWVASDDLPEEDQYSTETWMSDIDHAGSIQQPILFSLHPIRRGRVGAR
jgi:prepilin-type processing-associated H-X9-DG protein